MSRFISQKLYLLGLAFFLSFSIAMAQRTVKGTVTDAADGSTTPGVNVVVRGTTTGANTDMDGKFSLVVPANANELVISMVGYQTQIIKIGNSNVLTIVLAAQTKDIDEVVVVGYGTQTRSKMTSSIAKVDTCLLYTSPSPRD